MSLSIVIPVWSASQLLIDMEFRLAMSVSRDCDELIICEDGESTASLAGICDRYITHEHRLGHPANTWSGIEAAKGDYIGVLDFDVEIKRGSMRDLCIPEHFVSAKLLPGPDRRTGFIIWCSVTDAQTMRQFPMPKTGELLDDWADSIPVVLRHQSDAVEYEHHSGIGVAEWNRLYGG